jgi:DNA-binding MarR family transcriptional regulator
MSRTEILAELTENMGLLMRLLSKSPSPQRPKGAPTRSQIGILVLIGHLGVQNTKELAARLEMTPSAVTQLVDALVQDKLLSRREDRADRRVVWLALTAKGRKKLTIFKKQRQKFLAAALRPLGEAHLRQLVSIQNKIISNLQSHARR